jgi:hypothetical protein
MVDDESEAPSTPVAQKLNEIEERLSGLQVRPMLDNFDGVVSVQLYDEYADASPLPIVDGSERPAAKSARGKHCQVKLRLAADPKLAEGGVQKPVQIKNGKDSDSVTFHLAMESDNIEFKPELDRVTFSPRGQSRLVTFRFRAPDEDGKYDLFVEVSQRGRIITVVALTLVVGDG